MPAGRVTVATNSLAWVLGCIGMCRLNPSVVPARVAEVAFPAAVSELQLTANVVAVPGADGFGVMSTGEEPAWAGATSIRTQARAGPVRRARVRPAWAAAGRNARKTVPPVRQRNTSNRLV